MPETDGAIDTSISHHVRLVGMEDNTEGWGEACQRPQALTRKDIPDFDAAILTRGSDTGPIGVLRSKKHLGLVSQKGLHDIARLPIPDPCMGTAVTDQKIFPTMAPLEVGDFGGIGREGFEAIEYTVPPVVPQNFASRVVLGLLIWCRSPSSARGQLAVAWRRSSLD